MITENCVLGSDGIFHTESNLRLFRYDNNHKEYILSSHIFNIRLIYILAYCEANVNKNENQ